jgi:hypothetical protein
VKTNEIVWNRLSKFLSDDYKDFVLRKFHNCHGYSPYGTWDTVIADLVILMKHHEEWNKKSDYQVRQVKSKFGNLRFYVDNADDFIRGAIRIAELQCAKICKTCSSYGCEKIGSSRGPSFAKHCTNCINNFY